MPDRMPRRRMLIASATTVPLLFATAGCRSADLFAGPDPLAGRPPLAHDTVMLEEAIEAEVRLINLYRSVLSEKGERGAKGASGTSDAGGRVLGSLLAQHEEHLVQLRARLIVPSGASAPPTGSPGASPGATSPGSAASPAAGANPDPIRRLSAAERQSAAGLVERLATVRPALAQLFASIAASDATHVTALSALTSGTR